MSEIEIPEWAARLVRLSESLLDAGVDWTPSFGEPLVRAEIRVRRGAHLPPELVAEMKSALGMLRELVARTATTEDLEELVRRCEENSRHQARYAADPASGLELAERWRDLASRVAATGVFLVEQADDLAREGRLNPPPRITRVGPEEGWPPRRARCLPSHSRADDVGLGLSPLFPGEGPKARPVVALRSLRALVLGLEAGDLEVD